MFSSHYFHAVVLIAVSGAAVTDSSAVFAEAPPGAESTAVATTSPAIAKASVAAASESTELGGATGWSTDATVAVGSTLLTLEGDLPLVTAAERVGPF